MEDNLKNKMEDSLKKKRKITSKEELPFFKTRMKTLSQKMEDDLKKQTKLEDDLTIK
jgi:hypothetical protein